MGVPALFRWLSNKYPKIISSVIEEFPQELDDGTSIPVDYTQPNPNGEVDNLYLDMNGIVHPCTHPEDKAPPETELEMMSEVFKYTERVVHMARPRKVLMIAIDGVAPRAKMNQQRSRRFRSAQEKQEKDEEKKEFVKLVKQQNNGIIPPEVQADLDKKSWDSNAITPGTPFMDILAASLRYWISYKLSTDPSWAKLKIIISDATVPGEGEHKIMEFVRSQRNSPEYDPNTSHVIYGLDADLIMLGIATHEPNFRVLREDVFFQDTKPNACRICGEQGHFAASCTGKPKAKEQDGTKKLSTPKPFIWLHVSVLREYLAIEMHPPGQNFQFDLERALDDWVFMCFFVGNDFLPHLPSLDIRESGIDTLIAIWRDNASSMGGYVTKDGHVELDRAQRILEGLSRQEDTIFRRRKEVEDRKEQKTRERQEADERRKAQQASSNKRQKAVKGDDIPEGYSLPTMSLDSLGKNQGWNPDSNFSRPDANGLTHDMVMRRGTTNNANKSAAAVLKERMKGNQAEEPAEPTTGQKRKADQAADEEPSTPGRTSPVPEPEKDQPDPNAPPPGDVQLWEPGYGDRYYEQKFHVSPDDHAFRHQVARDYAEGLAWVLLYYFQGCPSWTWYYPHHYAPFAADFVDIKDMEINFSKGKPFKPFEQLMGVMPAASNHTIPEVFHPLMTDDDSDIKSFYPEDFVVDLNGKKMAWQGVALLPFIDEKRLLAAMDTKYPMLGEEEKRRNEPGHEALLFAESHPLTSSVTASFYGKNQDSTKMNLDMRKSEGLAGKVEKNPDFLPSCPLNWLGTDAAEPDLDMNRSMSVFYEIPKSSGIHKSMLLRGAQIPSPVLSQDEIEDVRHRSFKTGREFQPGGRSFSGRGRGRGGYGPPRGGRGDRHHSGPPRHEQPRDHRPNPFAQALQFNSFGNGNIPPPPGSLPPGFIPPPPPGFSGGFNGQPPAPPGMNGGFGNGWGQPAPQHGGHHGGQYGGHHGGQQGGYGNGYNNGYNNGSRGGYSHRNGRR